MKLQGPWCGKINSLFNLRIHKPDNNKKKFYAEDPHEAKYQLIISKVENMCLKHLNDFKDFI